ncbi:hypothetical protein JAAARDRAFT_103521, partial [Jaapia argillacea MUCL 33604]
RFLPLPPGPQGSFLAGVSHLLPKTEPWKVYASWATHFGTCPVVSFRVFNRRTIVLNTSKAARDLLDKRSAIYSDRPKAWMFHELCGRGKSVMNISASEDRHRAYRKMLRNALAPEATRLYSELLASEMKVLLQGFSDSPEDFEAHIRRNAASVIMQVAYGYSVAEEGDYFVQNAEESSKISAKALAPGRWLVDYYPILRFIPAWMPGANFRRLGQQWRQELSTLSDVPHEWVKDQMATGEYTDCFTTRLMEAEPMDPEQEDIIKWAASSLYAGSNDTTISALLSFVALMARHQDIQKRAQSEIDEVIGRDRLPELSDLPQFVYLLALMKEVLRFAPVGPLALPHRVTQDDEYEGYLIPKDATVIANVWALMHDESEYPDPFVFNPDRFFPNASGDSCQQDPRQYAFGFGQRKCPGMHFAEKSMLLIMAGILSRYSINLPKDKAAEVLPHFEFTTGITSHIRLFDIEILPRA